MSERYPPPADTHHLLFYKKEWRLRPESKSLRECQWLIAPLERPVHEELHLNCPSVPTITYHALLRTVHLFQPVPGDYIGTSESLMRAIVEAHSHSSTHPLERSIGELAVQALELQRPYVAQGLVMPDLIRRG